MSLTTTGTILEIIRRSDSKLLLPLYSMRGLTQTLEYIDEASQIALSSNGKLINLGSTQFLLFKSTIQVTGIAPLPIGQLTPGLPVTLKCAAELTYLTSGGSAERTVIASRTEGDWTRYRPSLDGWIMGKPTTTHDEWNATYTTTINFQEDGT